MIFFSLHFNKNSKSPKTKLFIKRWWHAMKNRSPEWRSRHQLTVTCLLAFHLWTWKWKQYCWFWILICFTRRSTMRWYHSIVWLRFERDEVELTLCWSTRSRLDRKNRKKTGKILESQSLIVSKNKNHNKSYRTGKSPSENGINPLTTLRLPAGWEKQALWFITIDLFW